MTSHSSRENLPNSVDAGFLWMLGALLVLGMVMLTSASMPTGFERFDDPYWFIKHQLTNGLLPGIAFFLIGWRVDYRYWQQWAPKCLIISLVALLTVFVPGLAGVWGTSRSWISLFGFSVQPVEFVKLLLLVYLADFFVRRNDTEMRDPKQTLLPFVTALGAVALLLMAQPDLGSLLVVSSIAVATFFVAGASWTHIGTLFAAGAAGVVILAKAAPYRAARLTTFLNPGFDPQGAGYHTAQALLAIGSGGLFGAGLGNSQQKYRSLPEVAGDSIFAIMAEELGFVLMIAVMVLLSLFLLRLVRIAQRAPDKFGRLLATGIATWVFVQMLLNVGSMVGVMPITGLPMPFVSYGGTSMAVLLGAMGVMANISSHGAPPSGERRPR
jgi:cell division protein FtsW